MRRIFIGAIAFSVAALGALIAVGFAAAPDHRGDSGPRVDDGEVHAAESEVTFTRQIAPILYKNCATCHHPGGSGPFSLLTYQDAARRGPLIESVTQSRYMPPWLPEPGYGDFAESRRLPDAEVALIKKWVETGRPEGDLAELPKPPVFSSQWQLGPPDLILKSDSPMVVPASGTDLFHNFILPVPITGTKYIRAMEIKPGSPQVVHHANVLIDRTASLRRAHPNDWRRGIDGMEITVPSGDSFDPDSHFLFWKPDTPAGVVPRGRPGGRDPGNDLILNMHLKPTGKPETVDATIGLYFTDKPPTAHPMLLQLEHDAALDIPANDADFVVEDRLTLPVDVDALGVYPHAHYLGKRMEGWAILPGVHGKAGTKKWLVLIRDWDMDRQSVYRFAAPVFLPAGTVLHMRYTYDNSAANARNPNDPPIRVRAGNRSVDEMGHLWLQVLPRAAKNAKEDPRMLLEKAWMENRLRKDPGDRTALYNLASVEMNEGDSGAAAGLLRQAIARNPNDALTHTALAAALEGGGDWQSARAEYEKALEIDPGDANARFDLGQLELRHEDFPAAEKEFRQLLAATPKDAVAHAALGAVLAQTQREIEARQEFETALALDQKNFDALYNLAGILAGGTSSGDSARAIDLLHQALKQRDDADAHQLLAAVYAQSGRLAEALPEFQAAQRLRPTEAEPHLALAKVYAGMGDMPSAILEQKAALALDAANPGDWNDLGVLQARAGDKAAARAAFERALQMDPGNEAAKANLARL
jgi:Flp pilus assembly protein TadD/mono/diheme cytochrome c family protein